ncbi:type II toxin-antitoxin system VapC family toxin [Candidatus Thiosymbion oneisti]|uniref:type II toxin-antitoxin system VapC family toxin n=1 Tax=Candidatus Thiosymbion oneisti TaxID=589554 RepID=UPI00105DD113|nr:type II toxin-antitoxin system VapC family toxin [Candidatus Thiosymbion oneisti]
MKTVILDTCVIIDYFRKHPAAIVFLEGLQQVPRISAMTVAELYGGFRGQHELSELERFLELTPILEVTAEIAILGGYFRNRYAPSHGIGLVDAIIGATAQINGAKLVTRNVKHFPMFPDLESPYP